MKQAHALRVSLKRFEGWEPRELTTVTQFDEQGRAVQWETSREPEWDDRERSLMLAYAFYVDTLCRKCSQPLVESMNEDNDPDNPQGSRKYVAQGPDECFCCKALVRADRTWSDAQQKNAKDGGEDMSPWTVHTPMLITRPRRPILRR